MLQHVAFPLAWLLATLLFASAAAPGWCDGPEDNRPGQVRPIPPVGIDIDSATRDALAWRCKAVRAQWQSLVERQQGLQKGPKATEARLQSLASEVLVFPRAVELALQFGQFYRPGDLESASKLLDEAARRIGIVQNGGTWAEVVGLTDGAEPQLIVGGYRSRLDDSFQPYSVVIPGGFSASDARPRRLDIWFHGRGETLSELAFLNKQQSDFGQYTPEDTFVLHPYGRYSNAFKFAGEIDVLEAQEYVQRQLPINPDLVSVRGFSMGGAACWQFATHYSDRWFAANPGAGFSETPEFLEFFQKEDARGSAPDYQQLLWQLYDCPPWAINLSQCPTVAYSGEIDRQKQAADVMSEAMADVGIDLVHVIGPQTAHKIHDDSKIEIESRMGALAAGVQVAAPSRIDFVTVTLRYHRMHWIDVRGLEEHWKQASVKAEIRDSMIIVDTNNVSRIRFDFGPGEWPGRTHGPVVVKLDGEALEGPNVRSDRSWAWELARDSGTWAVAKSDTQLRKRPGLQGPIDDAFMDRFLFVMPSGQSRDELVQQWVEVESQHAMVHWRKHFRGDIRQKLDVEITDDDIASCNLILFGDAESNSFIGQIAAKLPVKWSDQELSIGDHSVSRSGVVPAIIYPNPKNPARYIVLNSGFTFREYDYLNNARQTPKLPDWALIDVRDGANAQAPGEVLKAGFFDETWQPKK